MTKYQLVPTSTKYQLVPLQRLVPTSTSVYKTGTTVLAAPVFQEIER